MKTSPIPDFPSVKMEPFLHKLSEKITVLVDGEIITSALTEKTKRELSIKLNVQEETVWRYEKRERYPLSVLKALNALTDKNILQHVEKNNKGYFSKWKIITLPTRITPKLAYFIGYLQGDGSIESNEKRIDFTDEYGNQLEQIDQLSKELFGINGLLIEVSSPLSKKPCSRLTIGSLVLNSYLHEVFSINRGFKKDLRIPEEIKKHKELLRWYIVGLFDADGTLPKEPAKCKQIFIDITMKDKAFIVELKEALERFGIETLKPYCRKAKSPNSNYISETWELRIRRRETIRRFLKEIGFAHPNKQQRAHKLTQMGP